MTEKPPIDPAVFVEQAASVIDLPLPPEYLPSVVDNFARIMTIAQLVTEFPLPEETEAGPVFRP